MNYENFNLKLAIAIYLGKKEHQIDWTSEVVVDVDAQTILSWNVSGVAEPTIEALQILWEEQRLNYYRELQKIRVKAQYRFAMESGGSGCTTRVLRDDVPVVVDARRGLHENDLQNFREAAWYVDIKGLPSLTIRDHFNQYHTFTLAELNVVIEDLVGYGLALLTQKWGCDTAIDNATTISEIRAIEFTIPPQ